MSTTVLSDKDVNQAVTPKDEAQAGEKQVMSMEYHRQMLQNKMESEQSVALLPSPSPTRSGGALPCAAGCGYHDAFSASLKLTGVVGVGSPRSTCLLRTTS